MLDGMERALDCAAAGFDPDAGLSATAITLSRDGLPLTCASRQTPAYPAARRGDRTAIPARGISAAACAASS
jgi:hypothetical protein